MSCMVVASSDGVLVSKVVTVIGMSETGSICVCSDDRKLSLVATVCVSC